MSAVELLSVFKGIMDDVRATDLDVSTKKIVIAALQAMYPGVETRRRRREMN
jgi:hypothetical protein